MHDEFTEMHNGSLVADIAKGAIAGAAATWLMGRATTFLYERESERARKAESEARGGKTAYGIAAEKVAGALGRELTDDQAAEAGSAVHWALGVGAGATYGVMRHRVPAARLGNGILFGTVFWALMDEGANTALGLTPPPTAFPWETHARGWAGHMVLGLATDTTLRVLDRIA